MSSLNTFESVGAIHPGPAGALCGFAFKTLLYLYALIVIVTVGTVAVLLLYDTQKRSASYITILNTDPSGLSSSPSPTTLL
jgi:hypothetical protein